MDIGAFMSWASPALPYLKSKASDIPITVTQGPWLAAIGNLFAILGLLSCPTIMNKIGRKYTILFFGLIQLISWLFIYFSRNFLFLLIGRIISGIGYGGNGIVLPVYIGEVSGKIIRGRFLNFIKISSNFGSFMMVSAGAFLPYHTMNLVMISLPVTGILLLLLASESPYYYLMEGRDNEAVDVLMKLSSVKKPETVMEDIKRMKNAIEENDKLKKSSIQEIFADRGSRKAFIIFVIVQFTYCFSGYFGIRAYAQEILSYSNSPVAPEYETMILMGFQIFGGLPSALLIDHYGRRPAYLLSGILSAVTLGVGGLFFFMKFFMEADVSSFTWIPLTSLIFFFVVCNMGIGSLPYIYAGELFSVNTKGTALIGGGLVVSLGGFLAKILLPIINNEAGIYTGFWGFSVFCITGPIIIWFTMPETKGKNLEQVLVLLKTKNKKCRDIIC
ncbi:facilitated trehalose transporter Tret1-like [Belonocnema kinseyi]|uniref:facilitated trehalose transporter Tret1-like n=1 Tax=Belonocnema kinseyi TaxID=2817044 RepID=UPI00143DB003|nr:facilitated trehalose transporter Tret1-like [Belonocnema kinseyi]